MPDFRDVLQEVLSIRQVPRLYLDTNVILDLLRPQRRAESGQLIRVTQGRGWALVTSSFALMESLDIEQENEWILKRVREGEGVDRLLRSRRERHLGADDLLKVQRRLSRFIRQHRVFDWVHLDEDGWATAIGLALQTNLTATDCIHVATAHITRCDVLVTSDEPLRRMAEDYIAIALPGQLLTFIGSLPS